MKDHKKTEKTLIVLLIIVVVLIWGQSTMPVSMSKNESQAFTKYFVNFFGKVIFGKGTASDGIVRKFAHAIEYCALGIVMMMLFKTKNRRALTALSYCGAVALCDETIQIFNDRGPMIKDVWIDLLGAAVGITLVCVVIVIRKNRRKKEKHSE